MAKFGQSGTPGVESKEITLSYEHDPDNEPALFTVFELRDMMLISNAKERVKILLEDICFPTVEEINHGNQNMSDISQQHKSRSTDDL